MKSKLMVLAVMAVSLLAVTCKHELFYPGGSPYEPPPVNTATCSADTVYFVNSILPVINSGCAISGCHDAQTHEEGLVLTNYTNIMKLVKPGNAAGSELYKVITTSDAGDVMPPPPHPRFSADVIASIQKWINQGAKNNQCLGDCDTTVFTYPGAIVPIINTYCKGCHNPASAGGGIDLSTYSGVKAVAGNGKLQGSVNHLPGYVAMPQGSGKLADCRLRQIDKWIEAGAPDN